jgi:hypothetical protein
VAEAVVVEAVVTEAVVVVEREQVRAVPTHGRNRAPP